MVPKLTGVGCSAIRGIPPPPCLVSSRWGYLLPVEICPLVKSIGGNATPSGPVLRAVGER